MEKNNLGYVMPLQKGKPEEIRKDLEKCFLVCDGVIIVYGQAPTIWAREQLRFWRKIMCKREQPLKALAVYEGPPECKESLNISFPGMYIIRCPEGRLSETYLQPFLCSLTEKIGGNE